MKGRNCFKNKNETCIGFQLSQRMFSVVNHFCGKKSFLHISSLISTKHIVSKGFQFFLLVNFTFKQIHRIKIFLLKHISALFISKSYAFFAVMLVTKCVFSFLHSTFHLMFFPAERSPTLGSKSSILLQYLWFLSGWCIAIFYSITLTI